MSFILTFDIDCLKNLEKTIRDDVERHAKDAMTGLANQAHAKLIELAQRDLHSTREKYLDSVSFFEAAEGMFVLAIDEKAMWIEEGLEPYNMIDTLLKSPKAKHGKNGKYMTIPFDQKGKASSQTSYQTDLTNAIKTELKSRKLPGLSTIEKGIDGKPKTGLIHKLDVKTPLKTHQGPGQGKGAIGQPRQGVTGIPHLQGLRIYQHKLNSGKVVKTAMTFRTVSESQRGSGAWDHPGVDGKLLIDKTYEWCLEEYHGAILPQILERIKDGYDNG
jgi:hypothetical protein